MKKVTVKPTLLLPFIGIFLLISSLGGIAQQPGVVIDSSLLDRINTLEKQVKYTKPGEEHFMVAGLTTFGFASHKITSITNGIKQISKTNSIPDADHYEFSPLLLWRQGNKFLLEFEPSFSNDGLGVNWADISYFATPGLIIRAGYLVLPFGTYSKRLAAGWINKLATDPEGVADLPPLTDYGVELEGGLQTGTMKWSYDVALSNGLQLLPDGTLQNAGISPTNNNKMISGRIGWLPLSNSSLEIGVSGMTGKVGDPDSKFEHAKAKMYALDLNLVENIKPFQLNIKGQYDWINVDDASYINPIDSSSYNFTNHTKTGYIMAALRPMFSRNKILKNFEVSGRYGNYTAPANSLWGTKDNNWALGLNYWITWRTVIRYTYEAIKAKSSVSANLGGIPGATTQTNSMYLQFAIQL